MATGSLDLAPLKEQLKQATEMQRRVQERRRGQANASRKSLMCPIKGCHFKMEDSGASFDPMLEQLLKHYAICLICNHPNHPLHIQIGKQIGTSFEEATFKQKKRVLHETLFSTFATHFKCIF